MLTQRNTKKNNESGIMMNLSDLANFRKMYLAKIAK